MIYYHPTGPYGVSHVDHMYTPATAKGFEQPLLMRIYYPCHLSRSAWALEAAQKSAPLSYWIPTYDYARGYGEFIGLPKLIAGTLVKWLTGHAVMPSMEGLRLAGLSTTAAPEPSVSMEFLDEALPATHAAYPFHEKYHGLVSPSLPQDTYPVMVFSHGLGGMRTTYGAFCAELASHGTVVFALEHADGTACFRSLDLEKGTEKQGLVYRQLPKDMAAWLPPRQAQLEKRAQEAEAAIDAVYEFQSGKERLCPSTFHRASESFLPFEANQFMGKLDTSRITLAGHSFGAATAFYVISELLESRVHSVVALDPWMIPLPDKIVKRPETPFLYPPILVVNSEYFPWKENNERLHSFMEHVSSNSAGPNLITTVLETGHQGCSDFPLIVPQWIMQRWAYRNCMNPLTASLLHTYATRAFLGRRREDSSCNAFFSQEKMPDKIRIDFCK